ncbi:MAG: PH domain-containing protein [Pyrobaculum sp.]|jgi:uncharacterized membrane protein YdbT with pleckstrin-like domain|nr:PH domain-containing protein [Pyrobaculum sp.]
MQEAVYWRGRMSWRANTGYVALAAVLLASALAGKHLLLGAVLLASAGFVMLYAYLRVLATEYIITSTYIYARYGVVARDITQARPEAVAAVNVKQGILGRLLGYGDIMFMTPGEGRGFIIFRGVKNPVKLKTTFFDLLRKIKEKNRLAELLRELEKECDFGRLPEERCVSLRQKYEEELKKLE